MSDIIVGPSHVIRMEHLYKTKIVKPDGCVFSFIGGGGAPTWSRSIFTRLESIQKEKDSIHLIIGDFRFGNSITQLGVDISETNVNHINVNGSLISEENDRLMASYFVRGLKAWREKHNEVNMIPWTLLMRRADNILKNNYIDDNGTYKHPFIDEFHIINQFCNQSYLDCLDIPSDILNLLYIDSDLHPSTLGYMFISRCVNKEQPCKAIYESLGTLESTMKRLVKKLKINKKILITGSSIAIDTFSKVLPFDSKFLEFAVTHSSEHSQLSNEQRQAEYHIISLDSVSATMGTSLASRIEGVIYFPWDYLGFKTISKRHKDLERLQPNDRELKHYNNISYFNIYEENSLFDIGERLTPTIKGALFILSLASEVNGNEKAKIIDESIDELFSSPSKQNDMKSKALTLLKRAFR